MHVLIVPSWYETNTNPNLGSFFKEQALSLKKKGYKVTILYPGFVSLKSFGKDKIGYYNYEDSGINVYRFDTFNLFYDKFFYNLKPFIFQKKLFTLFDKVKNEIGNPDIIHVHSCIWAAPGVIKLAKENNIAVVLTEHSSYFSNYSHISKYEKKEIKKAIEQADTVLAVSENLKKDMLKVCNRKDIKVLNNMVNISDFTLGNRVEKTEEFKFLTVCNLKKGKGVDILIRSFANKFKSQNIKLLIGGSGPEYTNLVNLVADLNIQSQVEFIGSLSRKQVVTRMQECHSFILSSHYETFGVVLIEALACGKPIISTKCGGPNEIVNQQNGFLVETNNVEELSEAMERMLKEYNNFNPFNIRKDCIKRFSEEVIVNRLSNIYNEVIRKEERFK